MTCLAEFWSAARAAVPSLPEQQPTDDREFFEQHVHVGRSFEHDMPMVCERFRVVFPVVSEPADGRVP